MVPGASSPECNQCASDSQWQSQVTCWSSPKCCKLDVCTPRMQRSVGPRSSRSGGIDAGSSQVGESDQGQSRDFPHQPGWSGRSSHPLGGRQHGSRRARRGGCCRRTRGRRAGVAWRRGSIPEQCRVEGLGICSGPIAAVGFVPSTEKGQRPKVKEREEARQEVQKEKEEEKIQAIQQFRQFIYEQPVKISLQQLLQQYFKRQDKAIEVERKWPGPKGHLRQSSRSGSIEAEEERGPVGLCSEEPGH